jgi:hypothetical protein
VRLEPFGTLTIQTDPDGLFMLGETSARTRIIQELRAVRFEGERLRGSLTGKSAADWLTVDPAGNVTLDIRVLLLTDDGAHVFVTLDGRAQWGEGLGRGPIYSRVNLESGDEHYRWVNHVPLVSKGAVAAGGGVAHEFFEMI